MSKELLELIKKEGWTVKKDRIFAFGEDYPLTHPVQIHLKRYRLAENPEEKYRHMKAVKDYLWPDVAWHYWTERRFKEHCAGWNYMGWAGGASTTKSFDIAQILLIFWLANPKKRGVVVASTTLESLGARVWGYTTKLLSSMAVKMPFQYLGGNSPKILYPASRGESEIRDTIHGIFAVAAKQGSDESAISSWIGRHPDDALLLVLDEATDLNPAIAKALPNLDSSEKPFQLVAIGNSNSVHDLHGAICTPRAGWGSIDPARDNKWETTQKNGICLFFSCYESPAIFETDEKKKKVLSRFLITEAQIKEKEKLLGKSTDAFFRFVLGFWRTSSTDNTVVSKEFLSLKKVHAAVEWLGLDPLMVVGGLDPAFSSGGDKCILRLAHLGQTTSGDIVMDFKGERFVFDIRINARSSEPAEIQISQQVEKILNQYGCALHHLAIDASGQGRALGGTLYLQMRAMRPPIKIYNVRTGSGVDKSFDVIPKTRHELWFDARKFIESEQIKGLDNTTMQQLAGRMVITNPKTGKQELELKTDYKKRMAAIMPSLAHSPDEADAMTLCVQAAILNFGWHPGQKKAVPTIPRENYREIVDYKARVALAQEQHMAGSIEIPSAGFSADVSEILKDRKFF